MDCGLALGGSGGLDCGDGDISAFGWDPKDYLAALAQYPAYMSGQAGSSLAYSPLFMIPVIGVARQLHSG